ncbi:fucose 4-O-acetylase-like acetyltransferase [Nocardioides ginsengisegetis]|uniref:Fucose 4-O-acetylase-like acetyltransferase n=1 Tax=Nocardioides ginsengisegetis TaxID=661491 RepID=A0A7W3IXD0_9ACTN|nr:acyltransferase family protein [Nocardioides ginsengisegetis]MBA8802358.1 fucose 4-O-acetylase-like acetyltransferase [Nocardioides ginsengisegetis]
MPSQPKVRDPWFDNAKMALVTLVVVGHAWTMFPDDNAVDNQLYNFLYSWHVPAFVFVTGYLSRSFEWTRPRMWALFKTVVVPYLLFEAALAFFRVYVGGEELADLFADPHWPMWYLSALFFWRLMTPIFKRLPGGLLLAIGISLVAGMRAGDILDMARILGLLPFFVAGLKATPERLELLRGNRALKAAAGLTLVGLLVVAHWTPVWASTEWLYYRSQYGDLEHSDLHAMLVRTGVLLLGTVGSWAFLTLVPRNGGWFARMGSASLVVYLFHGFVVKSFQYSPYDDWLDAHPYLGLVPTTLGAVALALFLAWHPVSRRLQPLVDPIGYAEAHARHAVDLTVAGAVEEVLELPGVVEEQEGSRYPSAHEL